MIGLLILGQKEFGNGLIKAVEHTFSSRPPALETAGVDYSQKPEAITEFIRKKIVRVDEGDGVLILADIYGTTHTNLASRLLERGRIELISGANLPMLLRALTYRRLKMDELIDRAVTGGTGGIVQATNPNNKKERRS
ncbi:MAG: PTS fructose transporter subunit IIA [Gammaproteobacteria bacterium]|nr:PTS fructose transporter subunit IIA [Gammaproteobacteria bacterium]